MIDAPGVRSLISGVSCRNVLEREERPTGKNGNRPNTESLYRLTRKPEVQRTAEGEACVRLIASLLLKTPHSAAPISPFALESAGPTECGVHVPIGLRQCAR